MGTAGGRGGRTVVSQGGDLGRNLEIEFVKFSGSLDPYRSGAGIIKSLAQILSDFFGV